MKKKLRNYKRHCLVGIRTRGLSTIRYNNNTSNCNGALLSPRRFSLIGQSTTILLPRAKDRPYKSSFLHIHTRDGLDGLYET